MARQTSSEIATQTFSLVRSCRLDLKRLQDVIAEFRWSNEKNMKFLATVSKLDEEETELPQDD
jgi:hypothetical protein